MVINFGISPEMEQMQQWFQYAEHLCRNTDCCENCILAGHQPFKTQISELYCETGRNKVYRGNSNEQRSGS